MCVVQRVVKSPSSLTRFHATMAMRTTGKRGERSVMTKKGMKMKGLMLMTAILLLHVLRNCLKFRPWTVWLSTGCGGAYSNCDACCRYFGWPRPCLRRAYKSECFAWFFGSCAIAQQWLLRILLHTVQEYGNEDEHLPRDHWMCTETFTGEYSTEDRRLLDCVRRRLEHAATFGTTESKTQLTPCNNTWSIQTIKHCWCQHDSQALYALSTLNKSTEKRDIRT